MGSRKKQGIIVKSINDCKIIAHRGYSCVYPENTILSFDQAVKIKSHMLEFDIQLTLDNIPVVIHDNLVDRTTNGNGAVSDYSYSDLRKLDAGSWKNSNYVNQKIPSLEEVIEKYSNEIPMNIEIKTESVNDKIQSGIEEKAVEIIEKYNCKSNIIFSSFDPRALWHLNDIDANINTAILYYDKIWIQKSYTEIIQTCKANAFNCSNAEITDSLLNECTDLKIPINAYTIDNCDEMKKLWEKGISGVFTNDPKSAIKIYEKIFN